MKEIVNLIVWNVMMSKIVMKEVRERREGKAIERQSKTEIEPDETIIE